MSSTDTNDQFNTSPIPQTPGVGFLTAVDAARRFNLTNDHIALLCRKGKVEGLLVGRVRYVREESLKQYVVRAEEEKLARRKSLSEQMRRGHEAFVVIPAAIIQTPVSVEMVASILEPQPSSVVESIEIVVPAPVLALAAPTVVVAPAPAPLPPVAVVLPEPAPLPPVVVVMPAPAPLPPAFVVSEIVEELFDTPVVSPITVPVRSPFFDVTLRPVFATVLALSVTLGAAQYAFATPAFGVAKHIFVASVTDMADEQALGYAWWGDVVHTGVTKAPANVAAVHDSLIASVATANRIFVATVYQMGNDQAAGYEWWGNTVRSTIATMPRVAVTIPAPTLPTNSYQTPTIAIPNIKNVVTHGAMLGAAITAPAVHPVMSSTTTTAMSVPKVIITATLPDWMQYMPHELMATSYQVWDKTLGAFARSYLDAADKVADAQALGYEAFGTLVVDTASHVYHSARPITFTTIAVAHSSAANVWDAWITWLAAGYPQQATAIAVSQIPTKVAVATPAYTFPWAMRAMSAHISNGVVVATTTAPRTPTVLTVAQDQNYITQQQLADSLNQLENSLRSLIYSQSGQGSGSQFVSPQIAANGNGVLYGGVPAPVTTINSTTVHLTLSANDIPVLNYFPATSTIAIGYGGTGTSTAPTFGKLLMGNAQGGYDLVATSSLGIVGLPGGSASSTLLSDFNTWSAATSTFAGNISITGNIVPTANNTYSLGSSLYQWKDVFVGPGSIYVNGQEVLHTDPSHDVNVTADINQNLILQTSGTGDVQLNPTGTGVIYLKGNVLFSGGKTFNTSDNSATTFTDGVVGGNVKLSGNTIVANNTNGSLELDSAGLGAVYVNHGNFGVGTTAPMVKLDVYGDAVLSGSNRYLNFGGVTGSSGYGLRDNGGTIEFKNSGGSWAGIGTGGGGSSASSTLLSDSNIWSGNNLFLASTTIGTGTQTGGLTINGGATTTSNAYFGGNVGVGTASPGAPLEVVQNILGGGAALRVSRSSNTSSAGVALYPAGSLNSSNVAWGFGMNQSSSDFSVYTWDGSTVSTKLYVNTLGRIGIGTTSPFAALSVNGSGYFGGNLTATNITATGTLSVANLSLTGGLTAFASSTIGDGTQTGGLTINGGATTTSNAYFAGGLGVGVQNTTSGSLQTLGGITAGTSIQSPILFGGTTASASLNIKSTTGNGVTDFIKFTVGNNGGTEAIRIVSNGNIGVGTTTPAANVDIYSNGGDTLIGNTAAGFPAIAFGGSSITTANYTLAGQNTGANTYLNVPSALGTIHLRANNGNDLMTVLGASGNVGIGTSSPYAKLSVVGQVVASSFVATTTATSTFGGGINIASGCYAVNGICLSTNGGSSASSTLLSDSNIWSGNNLFLASTTIGTGTQTGGLTINGGATTTGTAYFGGSVGIGTSNPTQKLHVSGSGTINAVIESTNTNLAAFNLRSGTADLALNLLNNQFSLSGGASDNVNLSFNASDQINQLRLVSSNGNVGLSTSTPFAKLSVHANSGDTNTTLFAIASSTSNSTTTLFTILNSGNVGIGSANPTSPLTIVSSGAGSNTTGFSLLSTTSAQVAAIYDNAQTGGTGVLRLYRSGSVGVQLNANGDSYLNPSSGNVGIGTSTPGNLLTVSNSNSGNLSYNGTALSILASGGSGTGGGIVLTPTFSVGAPVLEINAFTGAGVASIDTNSSGLRTLQIYNKASGGFQTVFAGGTGNNLVGIGTTSPFAPLSIQANSGDTNTTLFAIGSSTTNSTSTLFSVSNTGVVSAISSSGSQIQLTNGTVLVPGSGSFNWTSRSRITSGADGTIVLSNNAINNFGLLQFGGTTSSFPALGVNGQNLYVSSADGSLGANLGVGTTSPYAKLTVWGGTTGNAFEVASNAGNASTTILQVSNAGVVSIGASTLGVPSGIFTVDASSSTTTISNLSVGNLTFDTDAGMVQLSDIPLSSGPAAGTIESQSLSIGGTPTLTVYGENDGSGGVQNLRVSVGTTTPYSKLSVWGSGTGTGQLFELTNNASTTIARFLDNGTGYFAGNIGIGSTSPVTTLSISGTGMMGAFGDTAATDYIGFSTVSNAVGRAMFGYNNTTGNAAIQAAAAKGIEFNVNNGAFGSGQAAVITSTGNFGVGTSSPIAKFSVHAGATDTNTLLFAIASSTNSSTTTLFAINNIGNVGLGTSPSATTKFYVSGGSSLFENGNVNVDASQIFFGTTAAPGVFLHTLATSHSNTSAANNALSIYLSGTSGATQLLNAFRIQGNNTAGFGTSSPFATLSVQANNGDTNRNLFAIGSSTASATTTLFSVANNGAVTLEAPGGQNWMTFTRAGTQRGFVNSANNLFGIYSAANDFLLGTNNNEVVRITTGNNVGIGSSTPWGQFSINPNGITGPAFVIGSSTQTAFVITSTGNVGVGTTSPVANFDVSVTGGVSKGFVIRDIATASNWFDVGVASAGQVRFNAAGGVTLAAGAASIGRFNIGALSAASNVLSLQGISGQTGNLFMVDSNSLSTTNNGSQFIINSLGYVGIATTSPFALLTVGGGNTYSGAQVLFAVASSTNNATSTYLTLDKTGYLAIGAGAGGTDAYGHTVGNSAIFSVDASSSTTTISNLSVGNLAFDVDAGVVNLSDIPLDSNAAAGVIQSQSIAIGGTAVFTVYGEANGSGAMQNGRVGIGTTTPFYVLDVASTTGAGSVARFTNATGNCTINPTNSALSCSSDERLKHNIISLGSTTLEQIMDLNPVTYNWNTEATSTENHHTGFIAQMVQKIFPDLVSSDGSGYLTLNYAGFVPYIVSAIQELYHTVQHFAEEFTTKKLCVADDSGAKTCITKSQLDALLQQAGQTAAAASSAGASSGGGGSGGAPSDSSPTPTDSDTSTSTPDTTSATTTDTTSTTDSNATSTNPTP